MNCQFARLRTLKPRRFLVLLNRGRALWEMGLGRERARRDGRSFAFVTDDLSVVRRVPLPFLCLGDASLIKCMAMDKINSVYLLYLLCTVLYP